MQHNGKHDYQKQHLVLDVFEQLGSCGTSRGCRTGAETQAVKLTTSTLSGPLGDVKGVDTESIWNLERGQRSVDMFSVNAELQRGRCLCQQTGSRDFVITTNIEPNQWAQFVLKAPFFSL